MIVVVIVDYNSEALTRKCLTSLAALNRSDLEFIVVDNGGSIEEERFRSGFPHVAVLKPGRNLGFAGGCNVGIAAAIDAGASYCLLLNPDTVAEQDFVAPLLAVMESDDGTGMACPTVLDLDMRNAVGYGGGGINWWIGRPYAVKGERLGDPCGSVDVPFVTGAALLIRAAAVADVGPMDEGYFLYFEDADYAQAFLDAGWKIKYVPSAEILHAASSVTGFQSRQYVYYFARNRIRFMNRWGRWHHRLIFVLFNTLVRLPGAMFVFGVLRRQPVLALAYLSGWAHGMAGR